MWSRYGRVLRRVPPLSLVKKIPRKVWSSKPQGLRLVAESLSRQCFHVTFNDRMAVRYCWWSSRWHHWLLLSLCKSQSVNKFTLQFLTRSKHRPVLHLPRHPFRLSRLPTYRLCSIKAIRLQATFATGNPVDSAPLGPGHRHCQMRDQPCRTQEQGPL